MNDKFKFWVFLGLAVALAVVIFYWSIEIWIAKEVFVLGLVAGVLVSRPKKVIELYRKLRKRL